MLLLFSLLATNLPKKMQPNADEYQLALKYNILKIF